MWGSLDFVFNMAYVCYRFGDRQILCLILGMFVTEWGSANFVFDIGYEYCKTP